MEEHRYLDAAVEETVKERFPDVRIYSIKVEPDVDNDGDKIYRISIVFEHGAQTVDVKKMAGFVRHLLPRLENINEDGFPIVSFISKDDVQKLRREPA